MAFLIDIPTTSCIDNAKGYWQHVATCQTKEEAVEWIRSHLGWCADSGNINLITECPDGQGDQL